MQNRLDFVVLGFINSQTDRSGNSKPIPGLIRLCYYTVTHLKTEVHHVIPQFLFFFPNIWGFRVWFKCIILHQLTHLRRGPVSFVCEVVSDEISPMTLVFADARIREIPPKYLSQWSPRYFLCCATQTAETIRNNESGSCAFSPPSCSAFMRRALTEGAQWKLP